jgi:hypothetical protein
MRVVAIYDNATATFDRYTVITDVKDPETSLIDVFGMSSRPSDSDGFSQWGHIKDGSFDHLGHKVLFEDLPEAIQAHIALRIFKPE